MTALIAKYDAIAAPREPRHRLDHRRHHREPPNAAGESPLGDVIADAQLDATTAAGFGGAVVAFMNPGGIRTDLVYARSAAASCPARSPTASRSPSSRSATAW